MIEEASLYANLSVETSPVQTTASWTNHIATVRDISLTRGGKEDFIGINNTQPGTGTISLVANNATILPGYWVRIRYASTIIWAGYVQDVATNYSLINGELYDIKTLVVLDWVSWIAQFQVTSVPSANGLIDRNTDLNAMLPGDPIAPIGTIPGGPDVYSQIVGQYSVAEILDLTANSSVNGFWRSELVVPTGSAGTNALVRNATSPTTINVTLTDGSHTGTPTNLTYYTDIQVATRSSQVVNDVLLSNIVGDSVIEYEQTDATSINLYGSRYTETQAAVFVPILSRNLFPFPSFENYLNRTEDANFFYSAEQPSLDSGGTWAAYDRLWAYRAFAKTTAVPTVALPLSEVVEVTPGLSYSGSAYAAASAGLQSRARFFIQWQDDNQAIISTTYGAYVNHAALRTWYRTAGSATAPAGAVYARVGLQFSRTTGANIGANSKYWTDGLHFGRVNETTYWDGSTPDTSTTIYGWDGAPDDSSSYRATNTLTSMTTQFLADNSTAKRSPDTIRINAQDNLTAVQLFNLYTRLDIWFQSNRWSSIITGITHNININPDGTTRWMIDLDIRPSTATI